MAGEFKFTNFFKFEWTLGERTANLGRKDFWTYSSPGSQYCLNAPLPNLNIASTWQANTDLDLYVKTPTGEQLFYRVRNSTDGGVHNGDACIQGNCANGRTESVSWRKPPLAGDYEVWMVNADGRAAGNYTVRVTNSRTGTIHTFSGSVGGTRGASGTRHRFKL